MKLSTRKSLKRTFEESTGNDATRLVQLVCATMLIANDMMSVNDPIQESEAFYKRLGHSGCMSCKLYEKCVACAMCE